MILGLITVRTNNEAPDIVMLPACYFFLHRTEYAQAFMPRNFSPVSEGALILNMTLH
jgi:hypothetical protein